MASEHPKLGLDTSCLVALLCDWHEMHEVTRAAFEGSRRNRTPLILPAHSLLECFSVLTRMPAPYRFSPGKAWRLLEEGFSRNAVTSGLSPELCWSTMQELSQLGLGGGRTYDAVIARSARQAGATVLLTWNVRDFLSVAPPGLQIREP